MRQCPKCGKNENEIEQTTMYDANTAKCPCGWEGSVEDLVENFGREEMPDVGIPNANSLNKEQIIDLLTSLDVEFDPKAKKEELRALYNEKIMTKAAEEDAEPDQEADIAEDEQPTA